MDNRTRERMEGAQKIDSFVKIFGACLLFFMAIFGAGWIGLERSSITNPGVDSNE